MVPRAPTSNSIAKAQIIAVLGPTNTGKTHFAMERLLAHPTGMIGFPLRLLARENYDRAVALKGARHVALITGEEKIIPTGARWFMCTVESMPIDRRFDFVAIDEIQMCADPDRGHVFTDRLLNVRGSAETMFLGAATIRPLIHRLVPGARFVTRPRMSSLRHTGPRKTTRLPPRSAVVAFSAQGVYQLAEQVRRHRGGAAVVLGVLSPRTRNAQVAMYQAGEVDYLVATDAIGMGLNMNVDHVAFAGLEKFDGRRHRALEASELAQTAGRAGRYMNDGTFGTTADAGTLDDAIAARIEEHHFEPLKTIYWRNPDLDFGTLARLRKSLRQRPHVRGLARAREADDELVLARLAQDDEIIRQASDRDTVRLLWEVAQVPDFRQVLSDGHARLLSQIYSHLLSSSGRLPDDWIASHVNRLDRDDGDIDTLVGRIAAIRTWTYVSFRSDWLADAEHWRARTRIIEDRLSDTLHDRLTQRFVDRRAARLVQRLDETPHLLAAVKASGEVVVEGEPVGQLDGFRFTADGAIADAANRTIMNAARRALAGEVRRRVRDLVRDGDAEFSLDTHRPQILWRGSAVGRLRSGARILMPRVEPSAFELVENSDLESIRNRLQSWIDGEIERILGLLLELDDTPLNGAARGLLFQVREGLGSVPRATAITQIAALGRDQRRALKAMGLRIGREGVFLPSLLKAGPIALRAMLWAVHHGVTPWVPPSGRVSFEVPADIPVAALAAAGYHVLGPRAVRIDIVERLAAMAWNTPSGNATEPSKEMMAVVGAGPDDTRQIVSALSNAKGTRKPRRQSKTPSKARNRKPTARDATSPFAILRILENTGR